MNATLVRRGRLALLVVLALGAGEAAAYCVYNDGRKEIQVWGEDCARCYESKIGPGEKGCCPGDKSGCKGKTWITFTGPHTPGVRYYCGAQVTAHGWVRIRNDGHPDICNVYDDKGNSLSREYKVVPKGDVKRD